jgi:hypothetical protein
VVSNSARCEYVREVKILQKLKITKLDTQDDVEHMKREVTGFIIPPL